MNVNTPLQNKLPNRLFFHPCPQKKVLFFLITGWLVTLSWACWWASKTIETAHLPKMLAIFATTSLFDVIFFAAIVLMWRCSLRNTRQCQYILDQVHDCVYLIDPQDFYFLYINESGRKLVGYSLEELSSMTPADIKPEYTLEELRLKFAPLVSGEQDSIIFETVHLTKEGRLIPVEILVQYLRMENDDYFLAVARDITDKRAAITEKEMLEEKLREAQRTEGIATLATGIAHDFNNILTAILGYTELALIQAGQDDKIADDLRIVRDAGHRAKDLVQQILTFSREKSGPKKPLRLAPLVKEVLKMIRATMPASIRLVQEIDEDAGVIMADPSQVHQLLMNLCVNALDAMEGDGGVLSVSLADVEVEHDTPSIPGSPPPGRYVRIRVMDTGQGMEPWIMARVFDPYFTTKEKGKGTGLGLAVVHGIVKGHGGYITVDSKPGQGTTFDIYFSLDTQGNFDTGHSEKADADKTDGPENPGLRIMVVDDEPDILTLIERILTLSGHNTAGFSSSTAALEAFRDAPNIFDLLLTDQDMPDKNGVELAREMKGLRPDLPVILCTGYEAEVTVTDLEQAGIKDILLKPLTRQDLAKAIARALSRKTDRTGCRPQPKEMAGSETVG